MHRSDAVLISCLLLTACASTPPPPAPAGNATSSEALIRPLTQAQVKVAHYLSRDGTLGLVLDRTGDHAKVRFDGKPDVVELTMVEDRFAGQSRGFYLKSPDGRNQLYIGAGGDIRTWRGNDELSLNSDKPAEPLPAPTVAGQYVAPKSPREIAEAQLAPLAVMTKMPGYNPEDSGSIAKIGDAIAKADASLFVRIAPNGSAKANWAPSSALIGNVHQSLGGPFGNDPRSETWSPTGKGIAKYGGILVHNMIQYDSPNRLHVGRLKGWPVPLAVNTPGLIWQIDNGNLVFVTLDGGRYEISIDETDTKGMPVTAGLAPVASWPAPLQHALFDVDAVRALAKAGVITAEAGKAMEGLDDLWFNCGNDLWKKTKESLDKIQATQASANDMIGRLAATRKAAELAFPKTCAPTVDKLDQGLVKFIEARNKDRQALYATAQARVASLGLGK